MPIRLLLISIVLLLAGCKSFPSGSGLESEVLKNGDDVVAGTATATSPGVPSEFAVEAVTRGNLQRFASWPIVGDTSKPWIGHTDTASARVIAPGDTVSLTIWNTDDNSLLTTDGGRFISLPPKLVSPDGSIFLPYIGETNIAGMSPEAARLAVEQAYVGVIPSVQAELTLTEGRKNSVSLISGVGSPGAYPLADQNVTLLEVLALAGGADTSLNNPQLRLQRGSKTYGIPVDRLLSDTSLNTTLKGGDRIFVESDKRYFMSLGAAATETQVFFPHEHVTALDALALIGGLTDDRANAKGILILRQFPQGAVRQDGTGPRHMRTVFTVDLTSADGLFSAGQFMINPGDLIYITEAPTIDALKTLGLIGLIFGLTNSADKLVN